MKMRIVSAGIVIALLAIGSVAAYNIKHRQPPVPILSETQKHGLLPEQARAILEHSNQFMLISLKPNINQDDQRPEGAVGEYFHGDQVLGKALIVSPMEQRKLMDAIYAGRASSGGMASCFLPHHGIHAVRGGSNADLVICFGCGHIVTYVNGKQVEDQGISRTYRAPFDEAIANAHLPTAQDDN